MFPLSLVPGIRVGVLSNRWGSVAFGEARQGNLLNHQSRCAVAVPRVVFG
jgi:hypothetical protein